MPRSDAQRTATATKSRSAAEAKAEAQRQAAEQMRREAVTTGEEFEFEPYVRPISIPVYKSRPIAEVSIIKGGHLRLNLVSFAALGEPTYVTLHYDRKRRAIGVRAAAETDPEAIKVFNTSGSKNNGLVHCRTFLAWAGALSSETRRLPARLVRDTLVVELGEAEEARPDAERGQYAN